MLELTKISERLNHYNPQLYIGCPERSNIRYVRFWKGCQNHQKTDILYLVEEDACNSCDYREAGQNLLLLGKAGEQYKSSGHMKQNLIFIEKADEADQIFCEIVELLSEKEQLENSSIQMVDMSFQGQSIQQIIDDASQIFQRAILLESPKAELLAYGMSEELSSHIKERILVENHDPFDELYDQYREARLFEKHTLSEKPVYFDGIHDWPFISANIKSADGIAAYLIVYECEIPFTGLDYERISMLAKIISLKMQENNNVVSYAEGKDEIEVLSEENLKETKFLNRIKSVLKDQNYVFAIEVQEGEERNMIPPYIRNRLQRLLKPNYIFLCNHYMVLLISGQNQKLIHKDDLKDTEKFLYKNHMRGALSFPFYHGEDFGKCMEQAVWSLHISSGLTVGKCVVVYEDCVYFHLLQICSENADLKQFCHSAVLKLKDYDSLNCTDYVRFLDIYLKCRKSKTATANECGLSRKTVSHRIEKIAQITGLNPDEEDSTFPLYLSGRILEYLEK